VWVHALDAIGAAAGASSEDAAVDAVRNQISAVSDPELLQRVATCLAVAAVWRMPGRREPARLLRWVERFRIEVAWAGSDG
jgi:hypothetical protein